MNYQGRALVIVQLFALIATVATAQTIDTLKIGALSDRPLTAEHQLLMAKQLAEDGQSVEAEAQLDQAIAQQHDLVEAYLLRATLRKGRDNLTGAITDYSSAIYLNPDYYEARFGRAQARYENQQYEAAREDFQYLINQSGGITNEVFYRGGIQGGEFVASSATTLQSNMKSDWLNYLGLCYWHTQEYELAEGYFAEAIAHAPQDPMGYTNMGLTYEASGDTTRAIQAYQQALVVSPTHSVAQRNLLSLARQRKDTVLEKETLAIAEDDLSYDSYLQRGLSHLQRGEYSLAIQHIDQALDYEPRSTEALLQRGFAYEKVLRFSEALADYTRVIQLNPTADKAYSNRGNIYFRQEKYDQAIEDYNRALSIRPDNATAWLNRGLTFHRLGEREKACRDLRQAKSLGSTAALGPLAKICSD